MAKITLTTAEWVACQQKLAGLWVITDEAGESGRVRDTDTFLPPQQVVTKYAFRCDQCGHKVERGQPAVLCKGFGVDSGELRVIRDFCSPACLVTWIKE